MASQLQALAAAGTFALEQASAQPFGPSFIAAFQAIHDRTEGPADTWEDFDPEGPTTNLGHASSTTARYSELHNRVVRVFSIYGGSIGVLADGPLWQTDLAVHPRAADTLWRIWVQHRAAALRRTYLASRRLRAVAVCEHATVDAFTVARSFPDGSPDRNAWMRAAEILAERAAAEARAAAMSETTMSSAVLRECQVGLATFIP